MLEIINISHKIRENTLRYIAVYIQFSSDPSVLI